MTSVRAIADDLSGALDAGAAFVGMCGPLAVGWRSDFKPQVESYIIDNETRSETNTAIALERTQRCLAEIADADYAFKKIELLNARAHYRRAVRMHPIESICQRGCCPGISEATSHNRKRSAIC